MKKSLPQALAQSLAIARFEFLMLWRQRAAPVLTLSLIALPVFFAFFIFDDAARENLALFDQMTTAQHQEYAVTITSTAQFFSWTAGYLILIVLAPLMMSEIIPKDRQYGVREIFDALPLGAGTYLNGKMLGAVAVALSGLVGAMVFVTIFWRIMFRAIYLPTILSTWLGGGSALILLNTTTVILLAAGQPTRRRAFALGALFAFACLVLMMVSVTSHIGVIDYQWWEIASPARSAFFSFYMEGTFEVMSDSIYSTNFDSVAALWQTIGVGLVELGILWFFARKYVQTH